MTQKSVFDIIGPVMIGPSSSHTAGAVRIGRYARAILDEKPVKAEITLYGSFAETFRGHGTDRALMAGILGLNTDDSKIKKASDLALVQGLGVLINTGEVPGLHPNTALIILTGSSGKTVQVQGKSVGGGNIIIDRINQYEVSVTGKNPTLLVEHLDKPGVIGRVTTLLGNSNINIAEMKMARNRKGANNFMVIETDQTVSNEMLAEIAARPDITSAIKIEPV